MGLYSDRKSSPAPRMAAEVRQSSEPCLVVRVPWLTPPATAPASPPVVESSIARSSEKTAPLVGSYQPHSFVASMEMPVVPWGEAHPETNESPVETAGAASPAPVAAFATPSSTPLTGEAGVIRRIDSPQPTLQSREAAGPATATPSTSQLAWHEWLLGTDRFLKENRRAIALALLLATACLLLLVLNSGGPTQPQDFVPLQPSASAPPADTSAPSANRDASEPSPAPAAALGPQGLAERRDLNGASPVDPPITPIGPHFEARDLRPGAGGGVPATALPYPSTGLPERTLDNQPEETENPSNVAIIRAVRPLR